MKKFFYALGIGCMLSACSSHEEPSGQEQPDYTRSNKCISISIVTTAGDDTRAGEDEITHDPYEDGLAAEYDITSVGLYLFNRQGECVDAEYYTPENFTKTETKEDPNVTELCTIEVELSGNRVYDRIIAVLNPSSEMLNENGLIAQSEDDLLKWRESYSGKFTMSNSVYVDDSHYTGTADPKLHIATPIGADNIYTKEKEEKDMTDDEKAALNKLRSEKAINIYVERVCSKILVEKQPSLSTYYVAMDKEGNTTKELSVMVKDGDSSKEKTITVVPEFQGIGVNVTSAKAFLLKKLNDQTYDFGDYISGFEWNDYGRHRSYWETTINGSPANTTFNYYPWTQLQNPWKDDPSATYCVYPNPNTAAPTDYDANTNEATRTTKLMVGAQLYYYFNDDPTKARKELDLVMFAGAYWMADYLLFHAAERVVKHLESIEDFLPKTLSADEISSVKAEIEKLTVDKIKGMLSLIRKTSGTVDAYLAQLNIMTNPVDRVYPDFLPDLKDESLKGKVRGAVNTQIQKTLDEITNRQIQYWKHGKTYFYVPIRHQGFTGLSGDPATDKAGNSVPTYLNGLVRNHVYVVKVSQIWGLGTPVINPGDKIDPERPDNAPKSYMTAKINVLKWKVVTNNVVVH